MKKFETPAQSRLKIIKATPRKETHGKELVQAISLRLEWWPTDNAALNLLHPNLQDMIFWTPPELAAQAALDGVPAVKKHLRAPSVCRPWKVEGSFTGYTLTVEHGIDDSSALELYGCALDKFEADAKEGGSAIIRWSLASNKEITPELVGALCTLEGTEVVATLVAPTKPELPDDVIDGTMEAFEADHPGAGSLFAAEHGGDGPGDDEGGADAGGDAGEHEPVGVRTGRRTARGRDATKKALAEGMATAGSEQ